MTNNFNRPKYCVYLTVYRGSKLPPFYIGSTSIKKIMQGYHGSISSLKYRSTYKDELLQHPELFKTLIVKRFHSRKMATFRERSIQKKLNVIKSPMYFNMSIASVGGFAGMDVSGKNNPNYKDGRSAPKPKNTPHKNKNMIVAKDSIGNILRVKLTDERVLAGELKHHSAGTVPVRDNTGKAFRVNVNDPRYISHELTGQTKGNVHAVDVDGNHHNVPVNDSRLLTGELIVFSKGKVTVKDILGNTFSVSKNDQRYLSGELVHHTKGTKNAMDPTTLKSLGRIALTDSRWQTGEIVYLQKP